MGEFCTFGLWTNFLPPYRPGRHYWAGWHYTLVQIQSVRSFYPHTARSLHWSRNPQIFRPHERPDESASVGGQRFTLMYADVVLRLCPNEYALVTSSSFVVLGLGQPCLKPWTMLKLYTHCPNTVENTKNMEVHGFSHLLRVWPTTREPNSLISSHVCKRYSCLNSIRFWLAITAIISRCMNKSAVNLRWWSPAFVN